MAAPSYAAGGVQGNLTGTVQDASTGKPLADVHVTATSPSGNFTGSTDAGGHFTLLGLPADTYTVSFTKNGYDSISQPGVAVFGDETDSVGVIRMNASLRTIVHVNARARSGAYQPTQTQDVTTISGQRITQALGSATSKNETNLILAAPGAMQDSQGNITVRGSLNVELGYQYDGVNFTNPFFDGNAGSGYNETGSGYLGNITGGSGGSLQVVSGSGDATQGNIGAGVINIVPPRGTYPASGLLSAAVSEPFYGHDFDVNYAWATPNNRFSDFFSYDGIRSVPQYAPYGVDASTIGQYYGLSSVTHDDIQNNFVFRFGHNNNMAFQWLNRSSDERQYGNYGGLQQATYYPYNPIAAAPYVQACGFIGGGPCFPGVTDASGNVLQTPAQEYAATTFLFPGVPSTNILPTQDEEVADTPLAFNKLGYTWNINPTTFLNLNYANLYNQNIAHGYTNGSFTPFLIENGGQRVFGDMELTHQFGQNHTTTLAVRYEDDLPRWHQEGYFQLDTMGLGSLYNAVAGIGYPSADDFYVPPNQGQPVSAANPCPTVPFLGTPGSCYVYSYMLAHGLWNGLASMPRIPTQGLDYHHTIFHESGIGLRDQWTVNSRLHLDYGLRLDADNLDWGANPYNTSPTALSNPSDVNPSGLNNDFLRPRIFQPRFAASYQLSASDALRFSYGRSVEFFFAQTAGTPFDLANVPSFFFQMPAKDTAAVPACGSGWNPDQPKTINSPNGGPGYLWKCPNYAVSWYWLGDQFFDAPDLGGGIGPPIYNNWDLQWSHQFTKGIVNGFGMKLTGFYRRGYDVEENTLLSNAPPNPITGQTSASVFSTRNNGVEKTSGIEFMLTSPDRPTGFSGFLTMNYISSFTSNPPVDQAEVGGSSNFANDQLPILFQYEFNAGQLYRSAFLPPFQGRLGLEYKTANGWKINPIFAFDGGYPTGVGSQTYGAVNGAYVWIPETNFGAGSPLGGPNGPGNPYNASFFVDPANPGNYLSPNIAASRGYPEPALPGNALTKAHGNLDLDLEYAPPGSPWTVGAYVANLFNNHYGLWYPNQQYQPVATGVSGPQTGTFATAYPGSPFWQNGVRDNFLGTYANGPFQVPYNAGTNIQFYLQRRL
ncbi:MAG TPA: carboxypeptidase-like regulatory domain-containing protein [Candidatus Baltobacteraceae bacterium]|nr:carboxypeptidase-like regulatory domain-containing protein [Candidatus Baltobacteraceae bacterium]